MHILLLSLLACGEKSATKTAEPVVETQTEEVAASEQKEEKMNVTELEEFGAEFTLENSEPAANIFADPEKYVGQTVRVTAKVSDVCQKMGCWMIISEGEEHMRVTTKDHKFFVAKDGAGSICDLEGVVEKKEHNQKRADHYKSEQSDGAPLPEAEVKGTATYQIVASAITFTRAPAKMDTVEEATKEASPAVE